MKKQSILVKVAVGTGLVLTLIGIVALGTKIGNKGLKDTMQYFKDQIKDKLEDPKSSTTEQSSVVASLTNGQEVVIEFVD